MPGSRTLHTVTARLLVLVNWTPVIAPLHAILSSP
jgi:hypothetical protein